MSSIWDGKVVNGQPWYVGSYVPGGKETSAQVIVPIEKLDQMTDEEIGAAVRSLIDRARLCNLTEINSNLAYDERLQRKIGKQP